MRPERQNAPPLVALMVHPRSGRVASGMSRDPRIPALRRQLAAEIVRSLGEDSQFVVAPSYGIRQPRMSELNRGIVDRCTVEWLIRRIHVLGGTVRLSVTLGDARAAWLRERFERRRGRGGGGGGIARVDDGRCERPSQSPR